MSAFQGATITLQTFGPYVAFLFLEKPGHPVRHFSLCDGRSEVDNGFRIAMSAVARGARLRMICETEDGEVIR